MKKQTNTNTVLGKKLEELEYLRESLSSNDEDPNVYRDIELRIMFAKTLLAAEISSRPTDTEGEEVSEDRLKLACMAKRLNELDEAFKTNQFSAHDDGSLDTTSDGVVDGEAGSAYSWVNFCQDELGKAEEENAEKWPLFQDASPEEKETDEDAEKWPLFQDASSEEKEEDEDAGQWPLFQDASSEEKEGDDEAEQCPLFKDASSEEKEGDDEAEQCPLFQDASSEDKKEVTFPAAAVKEEVVVRDVKEKRRFGFRDLVCFGLIGVMITLLLGYIGDIITEDVFLLTPT